MIVPIYERIEFAEYPTITLEEYIRSIARQAGAIGLDSNDDICPVIHASIQKKILTTSRLFSQHYRPTKVLITQYENQMSYPAGYQVLLLKFSKSKIVEKLKFDNLGIPEEDRKYKAQFDFDILYLESVRALDPRSSFLNQIDLRKTERFDFDRVSYLGGMYCLQNFASGAELRISSRRLGNNSYYGAIELEGVFDFLDPDGANLSPNYSMPDNYLYRFTDLLLQGMQDIIAYRIALENSFSERKRPELKERHDDAYIVLNKDKDIPRIRLG